MRSFTEFILSEAEGFRMTGQKLSDPSISSHKHLKVQGIIVYVSLISRRAPGSKPGVTNTEAHTTLQMTKMFDTAHAGYVMYISVFAEEARKKFKTAA